MRVRDFFFFLETVRENLNVKYYRNTKKYLPIEVQDS